MTDLVLVAFNLRSTHNVGSLIRTAEGLGVRQIYLTGYTPYPKLKVEARLPHLAEKINSQIHKTALGAEQLVEITQNSLIEPVLLDLRGRDYEIVALEQNSKAVALN